MQYIAIGLLSLFGMYMYNMIPCMIFWMPFIAVLGVGGFGLPPSSLGLGGLLLREGEI